MSDKRLKKGQVVTWRGVKYRITHVYQIELRLESISYPGVFHMVTFGQVQS